MGIADDIHKVQDDLNGMTAHLQCRAVDYAAQGLDTEATYCNELRRRLWDVHDEITADARANGILPNGGA